MSGLAPPDPPRVWYANADCHADQSRRQQEADGSETVLVQLRLHDDAAGEAICELTPRQATMLATRLSYARDMALSYTKRRGGR